MRGIVVTKVRVEKEKRIGFIELFRKYIIKPLTSGILGYFGFFTLLIISKYLGYLIGNRSSFQVDVTDFLLSLLGFAFIFIVKFRENIKGRAF
jgi:hypothetical protein